MSTNQKDMAFQNFLSDKKKHGENENAIKNKFPNKIAKKPSQKTRPFSTRTVVYKKLNGSSKNLCFIFSFIINWLSIIISNIMTK